MRRSVGGPKRKWPRLTAALGSTLSAWVAIDGLIAGATGSGASGGAAFYLFWGVPFAAAAIFLAWYAWMGGRPGHDRVARTGCLGATVLGGTVFLVMGLRALEPSRDLLGAVIDGLRFSPLAAVAGLGLGIAGAAARRGSR